MPPADEPTLTFGNGLTTIGGVQAVLRAGDAALCFDFGTTPDPAGSLFSRASPAPGRGTLAAYLRAGMAPLVEGLYDPAQLADTGGTVATTCAPARHVLTGREIVADLDEVAVFVSHLHNDHCGLLPFVGPEVPVLASTDSAALHAALVGTGGLPPSPARVRALDDGATVRIGEMVLEVVEVDHDIPGAAGFLAEVGGHRVAWTGDWRAHGHAPETMAAFARRAAGVDLLITEGTTLRPDSSPARALSETELAERVDRLLAGTAGLAFVTPYPRNLRRLAALRDVAAANGRTLVLSASTLNTWHAATRHGLTAAHPGRVAMLDDGAPAPAGVATVGVADLRAERGAFLVELQVPDRWLALATGAGPGDLLVHCNGEPLGPWAAAEWTSLTAWVAALGLDFVWLDSGGHATPDDLAWLVDAVRPGVVVAVHSAHPHLFPRTGVPLVLPQRGRAIALADPSPVARGARGADPNRTVVPCVSS